MAYADNRADAADRLLIDEMFWNISQCSLCHGQNCNGRPLFLLGLFTAVKAGIYFFSMYAQTALSDSGEFRIVRGDGKLLCRAWLGNDSKMLMTK